MYTICHNHSFGWNIGTRIGRDIYKSYTKPVHQPPGSAWCLVRIWEHHYQSCNWIHTSHLPRHRILLYFGNAGHMVDQIEPRKSHSWIQMLKNDKVDSDIWTVDDGRNQSLLDPWALGRIITLQRPAIIRISASASFTSATAFPIFYFIQIYHSSLSWV